MAANAIPDSIPEVIPDRRNSQNNQSRPRSTSKARFKFNTNKVNLFLDIVLLFAFAVEYELHFTGVRIHELLGLTFAAIFTVHILLHWKWVVNITLKFFKHLFHESRLNYVLNVALLIDMVLITITGIAISRTLGWNLTFGLSPFVARSLHTIASDLSLIIVGLHVALHWKWIVTHAKKYIFNFGSRVRKPARVVTPVNTSVKTQHNTIAE